MQLASDDPVEQAQLSLSGLTSTYLYIKLRLPSLDHTSGFWKLQTGQWLSMKTLRM